MLKAQPQHCAVLQTLTKSPGPFLTSGDLAQEPPGSSIRITTPMIIPSQQLWLIHTHHHPPSCRQKPRVTVPSCTASLSHTLCIVSQSLDEIADIKNQTGNISQGRLLIVDSHIWKANDSEELIGGNPRRRFKTFPIFFSLIMALPFKP